MPYISTLPQEWYFPHLSMTKHSFCLLFLPILGVMTSPDIPGGGGGSGVRDRPTILCTLQQRVCNESAQIHTQFLE